MTESLPDGAVIRVSLASFDSSGFAEVDAMNQKISEYLVPEISRLPGLMHYYTGVSPDGSYVHISVWDSPEHAAQMDKLKVMIVDATAEAVAVGVTFISKIDYPINWHI